MYYNLRVTDSDLTLLSFLSLFSSCPRIVMLVLRRLELAHPASQVCMSHAAATGSTTTRANTNPTRADSPRSILSASGSSAGVVVIVDPASVPLLPRLPHSSMLDALRRVAGFAVCFLASTTPPQAVGRPSLHVVPPSLALLRRPTSLQ